jgi:hypothetical protein
LEFIQAVYGKDEIARQAAEIGRASQAACKQIRRFVKRTGLHWVITNLETIDKLSKFKSKS